MNSAILTYFRSRASNAPSIHLDKKCAAFKGEEEFLGAAFMTLIRAPWNSLSIKSASSNKFLQYAILDIARPVTFFRKCTEVSDDTTGFGN